MLTDLAILAVPSALCIYLNFWFLIPVLVFVYNFLFYAVYSATPGKILFHQLIMNKAGGKITVGHAFVRSVAVFLTILTCGIGYFTLALDSRKRSLHDMIAGTVVSCSAKNGDIYAEPVVFENNSASSQHGAKKCWIIGIDGLFKDRKFEIPSGGIAIGRDEMTCGIIFPDDEINISRIHCTLIFNQQTNTVTIIDHNSTNGTFFGDGTRLPAGHYSPLGNNDVFYLAHNSNSFRICMM